MRSPRRAVVPVILLIGTLILSISTGTSSHAQSSRVKALVGGTLIDGLRQQADPQQCRDH